MITEDRYAYRGIKIIFSLISVMLMFPLLMNGVDTYYRTLFIFLIGKVVDLFFKDEEENEFFFKLWDVSNQIIGAIACSLAFCLMIPDFYALFGNAIPCVNIGLMICVVSCMFKDIIEVIFLAIKVKLIKEKISNDLKHL